jgi:arsenate reductase (glutaredoxin)
VATSVRLYGIPNCDTVKRARAWLAQAGCEVHFHDYKKAGVPADHLAVWVSALGWQAVLNTRGTTWRQLSDSTRSAAVDAESAKAVMREHPSVIKRPVVEWPGGAVTLGFDEADWQRRLA